MYLKSSIIILLDTGSTLLDDGERQSDCLGGKFGKQIWTI